jgi:patatin-like phospholipase/acyl hydrolase
LIDIAFLSASQDDKMAPDASPSKPPVRLARLLALDGGGVKGISALMILDEIMKQVKILEVKGKKKKPGDNCLPVDYFELAAGTSTGGLIAVLLFRLNLPVGKAIELYDAMAKNVFTPTVMGWSMNNIIGRLANKLKIVAGKAQFDDKPLRATIDSVVSNYGLDKDDKKSKGAAPLTHPDAGKL